jgi:methionyl-tRNA synthetase
MKKNTIVAIIALWAIVWGTLSIQAHADTTGTKTTITSTIKGLLNQIKGNKTEVKTNRKEFKDNFENITKYVRQNLTESEKKSAKSIIESRIKSIETLNKQTRTQLSWGIQINTGDFVAKVTEIYSWFKTAILPYIDSTKTEAFNAFIAERIKLITTNRGLKIENKDIKNTITEKKIEKKSEKELKAISEELKPLKELIKKIDEVLKKTKTQAIKDALSSAKKTLQTQIPVTTGTIAK